MPNAFIRLNVEAVISSPKPKVLGELIGWDSSRRLCVRASVRTFRHEYL